MITADYFKLGGKAFPQGCTFSEKEIKSLPPMKRYKVFFNFNEDQMQCWSAVNQEELEKALSATFCKGTPIEIYESPSAVYVGYYQA